MKKYALCVMILSSVYANDIHKTVPFVSHSSDPIGYWAAMNVNNTAVSHLRQKFIAGHPGVALKNRDESHITIITPPEYQTILKPYLSEEKIDSILKSENVQQSHFKIVCYGKGVAYENNQTLETYFLVVKSPDLLNIRKKIFEAYVKNGGEPSRFDPNHFTPHITIGFTKRDLFESDGVFKAENSCMQKRDTTVMQPL